MRYYGMTDKGISRAQNQDCFRIVREDDNVLAVVADGIGGHQAGDVASRLACDSLVKSFRKNYDHNPDFWFATSLDRVNRIVYELAGKEPKYRGMGTTMVAAVIDKDNTVSLLNVGDSRAYILDNENHLIQLTEDHSLINELIKRDGMTMEKAMEIGAHVITRAIGIWPAIEGDIYTVEEDFKCLMLCSDGLHNYVEPEKIIQILNDKDLTGRSKCEKLVAMANEAGGYDNITVVLMEK